MGRNHRRHRPQGSAPGRVGRKAVPTPQARPCSEQESVHTLEVAVNSFGPLDLLHERSPPLDYRNSRAPRPHREGGCARGSSRRTEARAARWYALSSRRQSGRDQGPRPTCRLSRVRKLRTAQRSGAYHNRVSAFILHERRCLAHACGTHPKRLAPLRPGVHSHPSRPEPEIRLQFRIVHLPIYLRTWAASSNHASARGKPR
jgi:hypothetical protein